VPCFGFSGDMLVLVSVTELLPPFHNHSSTGQSMLWSICCWVSFESMVFFLVCVCLCVFVCERVCVA
jgi:zinc transporter ZupT